MGKVKVVIEDGDLASWIPVNNTFAHQNTRGWRPRLHHWNGLLIEVGTYREFRKKPGTPPKNTFGAVALKDAGGRTVDNVLHEDFWIDLVAPPGSRKAPLKGKDHPRRMPRMLRKGRSLKPFGWITCWHDRDGYQITVREHHLEGRPCVSYEIALPDVRTIRLHDGGKRRDLSSMGVATIEVQCVRGRGTTSTGPVGEENDPPPTRP